MCHSNHFLIRLPMTVSCSICYMPQAVADPLAWVAILGGQASPFTTLQVQNTTRLSLVRDLTEHDVVSRIMRKENYLIGMLNRGVLALNVPIPGMRKSFMLTQTLEWNLQWCLFDCMFDERFRIRRDFLYSPVALQRRFR